MKGHSFKLFMAYPGVFYSNDGQILQAMQQASGNGATIMMHAENGIAIDILVAQSLARGEGDPRFHGATRPALLEGEATHRAIQLARVAGAPLYIVHLSAAEALDEVVAARDRGQNVFAETCPQYLFLSEADSRVKDSRARSSSVRHRSARTSPRRSVAGTPYRRPECRLHRHCPFCFKEQKELGLGDFSKIPNGIPGVEHRLDLIFQGVDQGELSLARGWRSPRRPRRDCSTFPKKGVIARGPTPTSCSITHSDPDVLGRDPPHERRLLGLRRHGHHGSGGDCSVAGRGGH